MSINLILFLIYDFFLVKFEDQNNFKVIDCLLTKLSIEQ